MSPSDWRVVTQRARDVVISSFSSESREPWSEAFHCGGARAATSASGTGSGSAFRSHSPSLVPVSLSKPVVVGFESADLETVTVRNRCLSRLIHAFNMDSLKKSIILSQVRFNNNIKTSNRN